MKHILDVDKLNELLGTDDKGVEIGYGEKGVEFMDVACNSIEDFEENAPFGTCWTDNNGIAYYKVKDEHDDARTIYIREDGSYCIY